MYIYVLQAHEYSDFSYWLLTQEKKYSEEEFREICKEADSKIKTKFSDYNYISDLISMLCQQYGFRSVKSIPCHIGTYGRSSL